MKCLPYDKKRNKAWRPTVALFIILMAICPTVMARTNYNSGYWNELFINGSFDDAKKYHYFLQSSLRLRLNASPLYHQGLVRGALGYSFDPAISGWLGTGHVATRVNDALKQEQRLFQQLLWVMKNSQLLKLESRTRLEERYLINDSNQLSWRLRQFFQASLPPFTKRIRPLVYDEVFININNPEWVSSKTIAQNWVFIGINIRASKTSSIITGYLNQYITTQPNPQLNNIAYLALSLHFN